MISPMITYQPAAPAAPAVPSTRTDVGPPSDLAAQIDKVNQAVEQASRQAGARAAAATRQATTPGVVKNGTGQIVVTGPDGKTITIDPKAGLDGDQIQEMVQTALQPAPSFQPRTGPDVPRELIPIFGIVFPCLAAMVYFVTRMFTARRPAAGAATATLPPDAVARLARIEQAVEAVAIEVERISEAQRYSAQLLTDRLSGPASTAAALPVAARADHG